MNETQNESLVLPGQQLRSVADGFESGIGTYVKNGTIISSLMGLANIPSKGKITISSPYEIKRVPKVGDIVIARVTTFKPTNIQCQILGVENVQFFNKQFCGQINHEDVKHLLKLEINDCYHLEDIILAKIIAFGNAHNYLLSTAEKELGVIRAYNEFDEPLIPVNWREMTCPSTSTLHRRKVACQRKEYVDKLLTI